VPARTRLGRLIRVGRTPEMAPSAARYVVLANILACLGAAFTLAFAPILALTKSWLYPTLQVAYAFGYLPVLWLNYRHRYLAASVWLLLGSHVLVVSQVLLEGQGFSVQLFFMLHAVLPFMVFAPRHERLMWAVSAIAGLDLVITSVAGDALPQLGPRIDGDVLGVLRPVLVGGLFATIAACAYYARRATLIAEEALDIAHQRSEDLLLNILPASIAARLKGKPGTIADAFGDVTVLFADIVGFTNLSSRLPPHRIVELLNELFCTFDDLAGQLGLEKIKTIGDCYMLAGGLPEPRPDHCEAVAEMSLEMLRLTRELSSRASETITVRVGIHTGPVVAGVIGKRKFIYDLWGDTVNTASRMESHGIPGTIQLSAASHRSLVGKYKLTSRGVIDVKGKGEMETWFLDGRLDDGN
jgi:class 3 adenylate cyclase